MLVGRPPVAGDFASVHRRLTTRGGLRVTTRKRPLYRTRGTDGRLCKNRVAFMTLNTLTFCNGNINQSPPTVGGVS